MTTRISLVTYGRVDDATAGPQYETYQLARRLHADGRLASLVCMDRDPDRLPVPEGLVHPGRTPERLLYACRRALHVLDRRGRLTSKRRIFEELFDRLVCAGGHREGADAVLFNRPGFPRTVRRARREGLPTIGLASILHPRFNAEIVDREQRRLDLPARSIYTDARRVRNLAAFYAELDHLVVQTPRAAEVFAEYGIPADRISRIRGGYPIDTERFRPAPDREPAGVFRVLHVSNMNLIKGIAYLLDAWRAADLAEAELLLAGPFDEDVATLVDRAALPTVRLVGPVSDPAPLYREADVFVSPSISDSFPYTILEAMASGTTVIASSNCGLSCLLDHGRDGFVYRHDDVDALGGHLAWCRENRDRLAGMGAALRAKAEACRDGDHAGTLLARVDELLTG